MAWVTDNHLNNEDRFFPMSAYRSNHWDTLYDQLGDLENMENGMECTMEKLRIWGFVAILLGFLIPNNLIAAELELTIEDSGILQYGAITGEVILRSGFGEVLDHWPSFSVLDYNIQFYVSPPSGEDMIVSGYPTAHRATVQRVFLRDGQYIKKPICLLMKNREYFFDEVGQYKIKAIYIGAHRLESNWVQVNVRKAGFGVDTYLESHKFFDLINPFMDSGWYKGVVSELGSGIFGDYDSEQAKLVIYQFGGGKAKRSILISRQRSSKAIEMARQGLELARHYGYGIGFWEFINDRINNPGKINVKNGFLVYPINEYYF